MSISSVRDSHRTGFGPAIVRRTMLRGILAWESWCNRRQGWQDLKALDDQLLKDIGPSLSAVCDHEIF